MSLNRIARAGKMSDDVLGRPARNEMSEKGEPMVAQPCGNGGATLWRNLR